MRRAVYRGLKEGILLVLLFSSSEVGVVDPGRPAGVNDPGNRKPAKRS
jgi:hypothetical protein